MSTAEEALRASELRYRRLFEAAQDGILILDAETGMIVDVNPFLIKLLGFSREAFLGKKVWDLGFFKDVLTNEANFLELQRKEYVRYEDMALETSDGRRIDVEFVSNVYLVNDEKVIQCNIRDVTERHQAEEALRTSQRLVEEALAAVASLDPMTGLNNRRPFDNSVRGAFARLRRLGQPFVLLTLDIDHFKKVNDTYGHSAGDDVLRAIGRTITASIREVDEAFRIGGEEFAVILAGVDMTGARLTAERLRAAIAGTTVSTEGVKVLVTASIGLAPAESAMQPEELVRSADRALYAAKAGGRNRTVVATDTDGSAPAGTTTES
jgi:diguanylate cyclase (GGDEF)-like protein/PAS domain S-box-containing protein